MNSLQNQYALNAKEPTGSGNQTGVEEQSEYNVPVEYWNPMSIWEEHRHHTVPDWQYAVANNNTRLGYHQWVRTEIVKVENA